MIGELHTQIETVQRNLGLATQAGLPYEATLHRARLEDLVEMAMRHGIDVSAWVDRSLLAPPAQAEGGSR
ncbi:hypothetical protein [Pseudonocardia sp. GCM10023141]|uniref:hypothetical protein n=1 Tax=Pseudonocardia sp. GCM10023141 TaxID=3252653 RepID=UPI00361E25F3